MKIDKRKGKSPPNKILDLNEDDLFKIRGIKIKEIKDLYTQGMSLTKIGRLNKASSITIRKLLIKFGVSVHPVRKNFESDKKLTEKNLRKDFLNCLSVLQMMKKYKCCANTVRKALKKFNIKLVNDQVKLRLTYEEAEKLCQEHNFVSIANIYNVHVDSVHALLSYYGLKPQPMPPSRNISVPCEFFKKKMRQMGYSFTEEYQPFLLTHRRAKQEINRKFALDICFKNEKVAIEINGYRHYVKKGEYTLTPYYQERHDILVSQGWSVFEIPCPKVWKDSLYPELIAQLATLGVHPTAPATETAIT